MESVKNPSIIEITQDEKSQIVSLATKLTISPSEEPELFCSQSKELSKQLPQRIIDILLSFSKNGSETGFLLIKNLEIGENIPKTPLSNGYKIGEQTILARIQSLFVNTISYMIAYEAECFGRLFQDVVPVESMSKNQTSIGSSVELEIHTEQAFSKLRPDILSLACLRGDLDAYTHILPVQIILNNLNDDDVSLLREPLWKTGVDLSFKLDGHEFIDGDIRGPLSIIHGQHEDPILVFDQDLMTGVTEESDKMVKKITDIYYKYRLRHNLKPGEIILVDNNRAVHGRSPFFPNYDGYDRFLVRCFGIFDYDKSEYAIQNNSRTVGAIYS
jgi:L-asparagine oxygenase